MQKLGEIDAEYIKRMEMQMKLLGKGEQNTIYSFMPIIAHQFCKQIDWIVMIIYGVVRWLDAVKISK